VETRSLMRDWRDGPQHLPHVITRMEQSPPLYTKARESSSPSTTATITTSCSMWQLYVATICGVQRCLVLYILYTLYMIMIIRSCITCTLYRALDTLSNNHNKPLPPRPRLATRLVVVTSRCHGVCSPPKQKRYLIHFVLVTMTTCGNIFILWMGGGEGVPCTLYNDFQRN
jgi:hypothetical protein